MFSCLKEIKVHFLKPLVSLIKLDKSFLLNNGFISIKTGNLFFEIFRTSFNCGI